MTKRRIRTTVFLLVSTYHFKSSSWSLQHLLLGFLYLWQLRAMIPFTRNVAGASSISMGNTNLSLGFPWSTFGCFCFFALVDHCPRPDSARVFLAQYLPSLSLRTFIVFFFSSFPLVCSFVSFLHLGGRRFNRAACFVQSNSRLCFFCCISFRPPCCGRASRIVLFAARKSRTCLRDFPCFTSRRYRTWASIGAGEERCCTVGRGGTWMIGTRVSSSLTCSGRRRKVTAILDSMVPLSELTINSL